MSALTVDVPFGWALIVVGLFWLLAVPAFIGVAAAMAAGSKPRPVPPGSYADYEMRLAAVRALVSEDER